MKSSLLPILLCLAAFCASCSKQMTEEEMLNFRSDISTAYDFNPPPIEQRQYDLPPGVKGRHVNPYTYSFVLDSDLKQFYQAGIDLRMKVLDNFYSQISGANFNNSDFSNQYRPLLAPNVRAEIRKYAKTNHDGDDLYMWQPFTPLPIVSKIYVRYQITYEGDDWFSITPMGDDTGVRLRVVLAGKNMMPVITELKNPAFDVNIAINGSKGIGKGYTLKQEWEYGVFNNKGYNNTYWNYVANIVYNTCNGHKADKGFITEAELLAFADRIERKRAQFLQDFCADLTAPNYTAPTFVQKYSGNLTTAISSALIETNKPTAASETLPSGLQVVLYGKELRPLVVGLSDETLGIDIHKNFDVHRNNLWYGISINKDK